MSNGFEDVSRETLERLDIYFRLLSQWQKKINLVSNSTLSNLWTRHVEDSLQCLEIMPQKSHWVDIGTGAGFPGMVIAIALADQSNANVKLVESNHKKCAFLRAVIRETGAKAEVFPVRADQYISHQEGPEIICARALMPLAGLLDLCQPWLSHQSTGLFHKGCNFAGELKETRDKWHFDLIEHGSKTSQDSVILEIANLKRRR